MILNRFATVAQKPVGWLDWLAQRYPQKKSRRLLIEAFFNSLRVIPAGSYLKPRRLIEPDVLNFIDEVVLPGDLVFDIGANSGMVSSFIETKVGNGGRVIAIEPNRDLRSFILRNTGRLTSIEHIAVSDHEGEADFCIDDGTGYKVGSALLKDPSQIPSHLSKARIQKLKITTLVKLVEKYGLPKLVKVDAEGAESDILRGASSLLDSENAPMFILECGPKGQGIEKLLAALKRPDDWTIFDISSRLNWDQLRSIGWDKSCYLANVGLIRKSRLRSLECRNLEIVADTKIRSDDVLRNPIRSELKLPRGNYIISADASWPLSHENATIKLTFSASNSSEHKILRADQWLAKIVLTSENNISLQAEEETQVSCTLESIDQLGSVRSELTLKACKTKTWSELFKSN